MKRQILAFLSLCIVIVTSIEPTQAQERNYCNTCFRGKPEPHCCSFFIFESGWLFNGFRSGERQGKEDFIITGDLGLMFNIKGSKALGGSLHFAADDDGTKFGIGPRYRVWLKNGLAIDFSPRLMFGGEDNYGVQRKFPGFSFSASISIKDLISIDSYYQIIPYNNVTYVYVSPGNPQPVIVSKGTETGLYLGISGRSYLAPAVLVVLGIAVAATWDN